MKPKIVVKDRLHLLDLIDDEMRINGNKCDLNHIDVSQITNMACIFECSAFNGDISQWDVSNAERMQYMFRKSKFNGNISNWNTSKVNNMEFMFAESLFDKDISNWNVSNVESMRYMFYESKFEKDISNWLPYCLNDNYDMFLMCNAPIPYWFNYKNIKERKQAINNYQLTKDLNYELPNINSQIKKNKI